MSTYSRLPAMLLLTALFTGCAAPTPSDPPLPGPGNVFAIPWSQQHFGQIIVLVRDESGLATGAAKLEPPGGDWPWPDGEARINPETGDLDVEWIGGLCRFGPTVTLSGSSEDLRVTIRPEDGGHLPPGIGCADVGMRYQVRIGLSMPVEPAAIDTDVVRDRT